MLSRRKIHRTVVQLCCVSFMKPRSPSSSVVCPFGVGGLTRPLAVSCANTMSYNPSKSHTVQSRPFTDTQPLPPHTTGQPPHTARRSIMWDVSRRRARERRDPSPCARCARAAPRPRHLSEPSCVCLTGLREAHARVAGWVDGRGEPCGSHGFVRRRFRRSVGRSPAARRRRPPPRPERSTIR